MILQSLVRVIFSFPESTKRQILFCILTIAFAFVPIWLYTTRVYRAPLPLPLIHQWKEPVVGLSIFSLAQALQLELLLKIDLHVDSSLSPNVASQVQSRVDTFFGNLFNQKNLQNSPWVHFQFMIHAHKLQKSFNVEKWLRKISSSANIQKNGTKVQIIQSILFISFVWATRNAKSLLGNIDPSLLTLVHSVLRVCLQTLD